MCVASITIRFSATQPVIDNASSMWRPSSITPCPRPAPLSMTRLQRPGRHRWRIFNVEAVIDCTCSENGAEEQIRFPLVKASPVAQSGFQCTCGSFECATDVLGVLSTVAIECRFFW